MRSPVMTQDAEMLLTEEQAAKLLGVKPITLRIWRYRDRKEDPSRNALPKAPPYVVVGTRGIRYPLDRLRAWIRALPTEGGVPQLPDSRRTSHREHYETLVGLRPAKSGVGDAAPAAGV